MNSIKSLKILRENGRISNECILIVDDMYLENATQYHSGEYVGADNEGNLYKDIVAFMIEGLKSRYFTLCKLFLNLNSVVNG